MAKSFLNAIITIPTLDYSIRSQYRYSLIEKETPNCNCNGYRRRKLTRVQILHEAVSI